MPNRSSTRNRGRGLFPYEELMFAVSVLFLAWIVVTG
jgi:hypothetical protein